MREAALLALMVSGVSAESSDPCWRLGAQVGGLRVDYAVIEAPARNFTIVHGARRFSEVAELGVVVTNGTFFESPHVAQGVSPPSSPGSHRAALPQRGGA